MDILGTHFPEQDGIYDLYECALIDAETREVIEWLHPVELRLVRELSGYEGMDQCLFAITQDPNLLGGSPRTEFIPTPEMLSKIVEAIAYCYLKEGFAGRLFPVLDMRGDSYLPDDMDSDPEDDLYEEPGLRYPGISDETQDEWVWTLEFIDQEAKNDAFAWGRYLRVAYRKYTGTDLYFTDELYSEYISSML